MYSQIKKNLLETLILTLFACFRILSQDKGCNRETDDFSKKELNMIPKEVCIPEGYVISYILDSTDIDGDGLKEFFFYWRKKERKIGDIKNISVYKKEKNGVYTFLKTLSNLDVIYFANYNCSEIKDEKERALLIQLYNCNGQPLSTYQFKGKELNIHLENLTGEGENFYYIYNPKKKNWFLKKQEHFMLITNNNDTEISDIKTFKEDIPIDKFNISNYMKY